MSQYKSTMKSDLNHIPEEVHDLLAEERFGISFQSPSGCQMQIIRDGKDLGHFYSYSEWGGLRKAVLAAISRCKQLRALYPINAQRAPENRSTPISGVSWSQRADHRRDGLVTYRYQVNWEYNGRKMVKSFELGRVFTADQRFHAYRTAIQFKHESDLYGKEFSPEKYQYWRTLRLYLEGTPPVPLYMWSDDEGKPRRFRLMAAPYSEALEKEIARQRVTKAKTILDELEALGLTIEDLQK